VTFHDVVIEINRQMTVSESVPNVGNSFGVEMNLLRDQSKAKRCIRSRTCGTKKAFWVIQNIFGLAVRHHCLLKN